MPDPTATVPDFELRKYELDRAHELELNKFAHGLEVERLKVLQYVNGGAFAVTVAFAAGVLREGGVAAGLAGGAAVFWVAGLATAAWATQIQVEAQANFNRSIRFRRNAIEWRQLRKAKVNGSEETTPVEPASPDGLVESRKGLSVLEKARHLGRRLLRPFSRTDGDPADEAPNLAADLATQAATCDDDIRRKVGPTPEKLRPTSDACYDGYAKNEYDIGVKSSKCVKSRVAASVVLFIVGALLLTIAVYLAGPLPAAQAAVR